VEDHAVALGFGQHLPGDTVVGRGRPLVAAAVLDPRLGVVGLHHRLHVDDVGLGDHLVDVLSAPGVQVRLRQLAEELVGHRKLLGRDEHQVDVELGEGVAKRVHGPHSPVADGDEGAPVDAAVLTRHRVQVGEHLGGVLPPAVAGVDHRDARPVGRLRRGALEEVAHHHDVAVVLEHVDGVLDRLLVEVAGPGHLGVGEAEDVAAEPVHGRLVGQPGAGRRLVEGGDQGLVGEEVGVAPLPGDRLQSVAHREDVLELGTLEVPQRQDVAPGEAPHQISTSRMVATVCQTRPSASWNPLPSRWVEGWRR
jgi:hypothetical protein